MNNLFLEKNIGTAETSIRFSIGAVLLSTTMLSTTSSAWIALLAIYPVITAIMSWDPLYASINNLFAKIRKSPQNAPSILPVG